MAKEWTLGEKGAHLKKEEEFAVLVGLITPSVTETQAHEYLDELEFLATTAGATSLKRFTQRLPHPEHTTFVGKGKVEEIRQYIERHENINMVIFDDDLSGKQTNHLEEALKVKILDRSTLILDIFAARAQSAQAKAQVELAQMKYLLPRLRGLWTHLERQGGGIGMRGPGETQIETDRRLVQYRVKTLEDKLKDIDRQSQTQRKTRGELIRVALVGYTNVGKSTLMNLMSKSEVLAENKLFATLDTTVRKVVWGQMPFLLSDTVGFIRKLPHHLVESFKSTLDEVRESDILLHVVDVAHPQFEDHVRTVQQTLLELGAAEKPTLMVFNKIDLYRSKYFDDLLDDATKATIETELRENLLHTFGENVFISAHSKEGIEELRDRMTRLIKEAYVIRYPHQVKAW
jgi:GTPase